MSATNPTPCVDCVELHGDSPADWLRKWPAGADWSALHGAYLCDGCSEERSEAEFAAADLDDWTDPSPMQEWAAMQSDKLAAYLAER